MNEQDKKDLMMLVDQDKQHIINYLLSFNLRIKNNEVNLLFSDGEVDETTIDNQAFTNLWELQCEPSLVKVEFIIERSKEVNSNIKVLMESLIDKITTRGWHDNHRDSPGNSNTIEDDYNCFKSIQIERQGVDAKVVLFGAIGYFS